MNNTQVGIYIGDEIISAVLVQNKNIINCVDYPFSQEISSSGQLGVLDQNVVIESIINKCFHSLHMTPEKIILAISDRDFIFRYFELPMMNRKEIYSSLTYEIEKYIPFKIEELLWDFNYAPIRGKRKVNISFLGIRRLIYERYANIFSSLGVKVVALEPAAIALTRLIKSRKNLRKIKNFAILDINKENAYVTFFYQDLPIFNRFLNVTKDGQFSFSLLKEEIAVSMQYFMREFREYNLEKVIALAGNNNALNLEDIQEAVGVDTEFLPPESISDSSLQNNAQLKAAGVAFRGIYSYKFNPSFVVEKEESFSGEEMLFNVSLNLPLILIITVIGIVGAVFFSLILDNKISEEKMLLSQKEKNLLMESEIKDKSIEDIKIVIQEKKKEVQVVKEEMQKYRKISEILRRIVINMPDQLWLESLSLSQQPDITVTLTGHILLLEKNNTASRIFDVFINNLRSDSNFLEFFPNKDIQPVNFQNNNIEGYDVMNFSLEIR